MPELSPIMVNPEERRESIRQKVIEGLQESFPLKSRNKTLELDDLRFDSKDFGSDDEKQALLKGESLYDTVKGTLRMRDNEGKILDETKNFTLVRVPYFTPRHTLILDGKEYSVSNMLRRKPGVYARKRANGILEANFNTLGGKNFKVSMDPAKGEPQLEYGTTKIPLYPILRKAGIQHKQIVDAWGKKLADKNEENLFSHADRAVDKLYNKEVPDYKKISDATSEQKMQLVLSRYAMATMDPEVNKQTLGKPYKNVTPDSLLDASAKVLNIFNDTDDVDDQDNLDFKKFIAIDDLFKERIKLDAREVSRKAAIKMEANPDLRRAVPPGFFTKGLRQFINTSQLVAVPTQVNPMELIDSAMRVTSLGEGGITSERAIPLEARQTHVTQIGALDPIRTPESFRAGVDVRAAMLAKRDAQGNIYVPLYDVKSGRNKHVRAGVLYSTIIAFPNQELKGHVEALVKGHVRTVPASKVDYQIPHTSYMYSPTTNLIPFLESSQGNRAIMGSKMQTQALSLVDREAPYVQVKAPSGKSFEEMMGHMINPYAPVDGTIAKIDKNYIYIRPHRKKESASKKDKNKNEELVRVSYNNNFPLASKTYLHHNISVKPGDEVAEGQFLGDSNFTKDGILALGKNLRVAYMPYYGMNSNDAVVVSEGAAKKLTSERMYKIIIPRNPDLSFKKIKHRAYYGHNYTKDQYSKLDDDGVVVPGTELLPSDPVIVGLRKTQLSADDLILGKLHRALVKPYREYVQDWSHDNLGEVVDVVKTPKQFALTIKTREPAVIGDKLCYTGDTEVLTDSGWKFISLITKKDICYTLNPLGKIELHCPTQIYHYPTAGKIVDIHSQQVDLRVTAGHRHLVKLRDRTTFELLEISKILNKRFRNKKHGIWNVITPEYFKLPAVTFAHKGKGCVQTKKASSRFTKIPMQSWLNFLGAYLANGCTAVTKRKDRNNALEYRVVICSEEDQIHSVSGKQQEWIKKILDSCGFPYISQPKCLSITSKQLALYLKPFGHAKNKYVPREIFTWGKDAAQWILEGLMGCDGHRTKSNSFVYTTVSPQLANDVQVLALHAGMAANIVLRKSNNKNWSDLYSVRLIQAKCEPEINHGHNKTQKGQLIQTYISDEPVYGMTISNHTLYVRVNGKPVWSGNSGQFGNKGVISKIIPDDQMIQDEEGNPIDVILTSAGVVSRINPSQLIAAAAGKVVHKTGKPILIENFTGRDNVQWAKDLLKKHGLKDKETVFDPVSGKKISGVFVGNPFIMKLMKSTETNYSARGVPESYDVNQQPTKGGVNSSKALGKMEFDALVAHNARNILKDSASIKSQKNDEYWRAVQLGYPLPTLKTSFAYDKFNNMLAGAGIKLNRDKHMITLAPLTDNDVDEMSSGEITDSKIIRAKDLKPEIGGLMDPMVTGGLKGKKWGTISLAEPIVNPVFKEPVRRFLGMTNTQLDKALQEQGGDYIRRELKKINLDDFEQKLNKDLNSKKATALDDSVKKLKYIRALKALALTPDKAYIISKVPVIPPEFRPVIPMTGSSQLLYGDANPLYQDLIYINNQLKEVKKENVLPGEEERLRPVLQNAVSAVYGMGDPVTAKSQARGHKGFLTYIAGKGSPKYGYFQSRLMKRTQDVAGRGTAVPDYMLDMDEVGIPEDMLWTMYDKFIIRRLVQNGFPAIQAKQMTENKHPGAREMLLREIQERPVLINRAPTLHRYNIVAATPRPVTGKTLRVNPFIEKGFNLDYDGDAIQIHVPVSNKAIQDAEAMKLSNIIFGDKSKQDLLVFPQHEAIMGINRMSSPDDKNKPKIYKTDADAMKEYSEGKIGLGTHVKIEEKKQ